MIYFFKQSQCFQQHRILTIYSLFYQKLSSLIIEIIKYKIIQMTERKKRNMESISQDIHDCKNNLNKYEGTIISNISSFNTPEKNNSQKHNNLTSNNTTNISTNSMNQSRDKQDNKNPNNESVSKYIEYMSKLNDYLQERSIFMEIQNEKQRLNHQNKIEKLNAQLIELTNQLNRKQSEIKQKNETINTMKNQITVLDKSNKEKTAKITELNEIIDSKNQENIALKLQNKNLKADNKVIMNHIDRLTLQAKNQEKKQTTLAERQMRVMKSLYQDPLPNLEAKQHQRRKEQVQDLSTKIKLHDSEEYNSQLKYLIKKLNEEKQILQRQKNLLAEDNRQKCLNLQNQKLLTEMSNSQIEKLNNLIIKMGQKIISLQNAYVVLKQERLEKQQINAQEENYYRTNRIKTGRFYYKK